MTVQIDTLEKALGRASAEAASLKERLQAVERLRKLLDGVVAAQENRPALTLQLLEKDRAAIEEAATDEEREVLRQLWTECAERTQQASRDAVKTFPARLEARHLAIDPSSRHPRYSVDNRLLDVELDARKHVAVIRPRHGDPVREALDPEAVADRVKAERDRLLERPFDAKAFMKKLTAAHATLSKPKKGAPPPTVMVRDLAAQMAKPAKPKLDEFAVDLGRLLTQGEAAHGLQANHTRDTDKGLLLYGLEQGGYVGSIDMRRSS